MTIEFILKRFLLVTLPYMNDMISISIYKELQSCSPIIKSFVALKVLIQNERTPWFTARTLRSASVQGIVRVGYSLLFFYRIMQIVRGGKVSRLADLSVIRGKTFAIVQQFETPYNEKDKNLLEILRDWRLIRENRKKFLP